MSYRGDQSLAQPPEDKHPSVYRLWQRAREEKEEEGERLERYYELLEEYGHRSKPAEG